MALLTMALLTMGVLTVALLTMALLTMAGGGTRALGRREWYGAAGKVKLNYKRAADSRAASLHCMSARAAAMLESLEDFKVSALSVFELFRKAVSTTGIRDPKELAIQHTLKYFPPVCPEPRDDLEDLWCTFMALAHPRHDCCHVSLPGSLSTGPPVWTLGHTEAVDRIQAAAGITCALNRSPLVPARPGPACTMPRLR